MALKHKGNLFAAESNISGVIFNINAQVIDKSWWQVHVVFGEMFTFHTNVFVSPFPEAVLWQSSALSNRDYLLVPTTWQEKKHCQEVWVCWLRLWKCEETCFKNHNSRKCCPLTSGWVSDLSPTKLWTFWSCDSTWFEHLWLRLGLRLKHWL